MKNKARIIALLLLAALFAGLLAGCGSDSESAQSGADSAGSDGVDVSKAVQISLDGGSASVSGGGAAANGSTVTISAAGEYAVSGTLDDGQIIVNTGDDAMRVTLILNNANITCTTGAAISVEKADKVKLVLAEGSVNTVTSGREGSPVDDNASGAAIFSKDDLDLEGSGSLTVNAYINNGIASKNDLKVQGGSITVNAVNNGLRGADSVQIEAGTLVINAGNDGVKSVTVDKAGKGFVSVSGGDVTITAAGDCIDAATTLDVTGGRLTASAAGADDGSSSKVLKAESGINISGGELTLSAAQTVVKSAASLNVSGGSIAIVSDGGKGISVDGSVAVSGGDVQISAFSDGILVVDTVSVSGGSVNIVSGSDGIQAGKNVNGFPSETGTAEISGGEVYISAAKRAIDAKVGLEIKAGTVLALSGAKNPLEVKGGGQSYVSVPISAFAGDEVSFGELASVTAKWDVTSLLFSSAKLQRGSEYTVVCGESRISVTA